MKIHDNGIDREATAAEIAEHETLWQLGQNVLSNNAERAAAAASGRAKLAAIGLTEAEIVALLP